LGAFFDKKWVIPIFFPFGDQPDPGKKGLTSAVEKSIKKGSFVISKSAGFSSNQNKTGNLGHSFLLVLGLKTLSSENFFLFLILKKGIDRNLSFLIHFS
jgi:hypothetical protein